MEIISRKEAKEKGLSRFFTGKPCKHGHVCERYASYGGCVQCAYLHAITYREKNHEWWNQYMSQWRKDNAHKPKEYYWKDPEKRRDRARKQHEKHKEKRQEANRKYKKENPIANRARQSKRRARIKKCEGSFYSYDVETLLKMQKGRCAFCNKEVKRKYHIDHIYPISLGGSNTKENLQILCPSCNLSKHAKDPIEWAQMNGRLL